MFNFINRQLNLLRKNGISEISRKFLLLSRLVFNLFLYFLFFPFCLVVFLFYTLFGFTVICNPIISWRLGHFAGNLDFFLTIRKKFYQNKKIVNFWFHPCTPCNLFFAKMVSRKIFVIPYYFGIPLKIITNLFYIHQINTDRDIYNLLDTTPPNFKFTDAEIHEGYTFLSSLGIKKNDKFVCLNVRDDSYLNMQSKLSGSRVDWSYHNYRNCNINNYRKAALTLANNGYYVFRMGAAVNKKFDLNHPRIFDYACNGMRTDFLDIFLGSHCTFTISNGTGFDAIPYIFRKPILYVDHVPLGIVNTFSKRFLITTKKVWSSKLKRFLRFDELFYSGIGYDFSGDIKKYENNLSFVESSEDEINEYVDEMRLRLENKWHDTMDDKKNQERFWDIFDKRKGIHGKIKSKISTMFIRRNVKLLDYE
jgi:putative glycosyltransferase (TIGR04372 family)